MYNVLPTALIKRVQCLLLLEVLHSSRPLRPLLRELPRYSNVARASACCTSMHGLLRGKVRVLHRGADWPLTETGHGLVTRGRGVHCGLAYASGTATALQSGARGTIRLMSRAAWI